MRWLRYVIYFVILVILVILGLLLAYFLGYNIPLTSARMDDIAKTIVGPSITINGLCVTLVPVISFFFSAESKKIQEESLETIREDFKEFKEEDMKVVASLYALAYNFWYNSRIGVLEYTRSYIIISLTSLLSLLLLYIGLSPVQFVIADVSFLFAVFSGIYPIVAVALSKPARKLIEMVKKDHYELMAPYP